MENPFSGMETSELADLIAELFAHGLSDNEIEQDLANRKAYSPTNLIAVIRQLMEENNEASN